MNKTSLFFVLFILISSNIVKTIRINSHEKKSLNTDDATNDPNIIVDSTITTDTDMPPTDTDMPPIDTAGVPPTDTDMPPTDTDMPPIDTDMPPIDTAGVPPTDTAGVPPTDTDMPPTDTDMPPTDTAGVPPIDTAGVPPIDTAGVPPTDTDMPPTDTAGVPPTDTDMPPTGTDMYGPPAHIPVSDPSMTAIPSDPTMMFDYSDPSMDPNFYMMPPMPIDELSDEFFMPPPMEVNDEYPTSCDNELTNTDNMDGYDKCLDKECEKAKYKDGMFCLGHIEYRKMFKEEEKKRKKQICGDKEIYTVAYDNCMNEECNKDNNKERIICKEFRIYLKEMKMYESCDSAFVKSDNEGEKCIAKECKKKENSNIPYCSTMIEMNIYQPCETKKGVEMDKCVYDQCNDKKKGFYKLEFCKDFSKNFAENLIWISCDKEVGNATDGDIGEKYDKCLIDRCGKDKFKNIPFCKDEINVMVKENNIFRECDKVWDRKDLNDDQKYEEYRKTMNTLCEKEGNKNLSLCKESKLTNKCEKADDWDICIEDNCSDDQYKQTWMCEDVVMHLEELL